jgi:competence protein ComEC
MGEKVVVPLLLDYGVTQLDLVVATHGHDDHIQGLYSVLRELGAGCLIIPDCSGSEELSGLVHLAESRGIVVKRCGSGDMIRLDGRTCIKVLSPDRKHKNEMVSLNNTSLVLKLIHGRISMLMTGDIEKEIEQCLLSQGADVRADVLKVAHHGSSSSTGLDFLKAVEPDTAVICTGENNFGHPSPVVLERLENAGVNVYRTDRDGAVILTTDGKSITFKTTMNNRGPVVLKK